MDSFEFALLAMRNTLSDMWAGFARFMDWIAIGNPHEANNWQQPCAADLVNDPKFNWDPNNKHYAFKLTDPAFDGNMFNPANSVFLDNDFIRRNE